MLDFNPDLFSTISELGALSCVVSIHKVFRAENVTKVRYSERSGWPIIEGKISLVYNRVGQLTHCSLTAESRTAKEHPDLHESVEILRVSKKRRNIR